MCRELTVFEVSVVVDLVVVPVVQVLFVHLLSRLLRFPGLGNLFVSGLLLGSVGQTFDLAGQE